MKNRHIIRDALDLTLAKLDVEMPTEDLLCKPIRGHVTLLVLNSVAEKIQSIQASSRDTDIFPVGLPEQKGATVAAEASRDIFGLAISFDLVLRVILPLDGGGGNCQGGEEEASRLFATLGALANAP